MRSEYSSVTPAKSQHCIRDRLRESSYVVEDRVVDTRSYPLREVAVQVFGQQKIAESAILRVQEVHALYLFENHVLVFRAELCAAVGQQQL